MRAARPGGARWVRADGVQLADGDFIPSELVVWAAGVRGPEVVNKLDAATNAGKRRPTANN